jgi:hypothetical protein
MNSSLSFVSMAFALITNTASTAATGTGQWYYGPDTSENVACARAEQLAKADAVRNVIGEAIFIDEFSNCSEVKGEAKCRYESSIFSVTDSYIRKSTITERTIGTSLNRNVCTVEVNVKVTNDKPKIDANVNGRFFYKEGETMSWDLKTSDPTKVYIYHIEGNKATMMWPTFVGTNNSVANELTVPTPGYKFKARAGRLTESLVFVFTNEKINLMRNYELDDLNSKLLSIPISERRIVRRNLVIEQ